MEARDEIHHLRDGAEGLIRRVFVLKNYELVGFGNTGTSDGWNGAGFVNFDNDVEEVEDGTMWGVNIYRANIVALCGPVDGFVGLGVEFL